MNPRDPIEAWISDFLESPSANACRGVTREYAPEVLAAFLEAACAHRDVDPSEIEEGDLKPALLEGVGRLEIPGSVRPEIPALCAAFLEGLAAEGRLAGGRTLALYVKALRGAWLQIGAPIVSPAAKIGRNDPCPCGSGLKYKRCCMRRLDA